MAEYQLGETDALVIRTADMAHIPNDEGNRDWRDYQAWLEAGGVPDPYVPPPDVPPPPDALAEAQRANARLDAGAAAAVSVTPPAPPPARTGAPPENPTREEFDALTARVDYLETTMERMLRAQTPPRIDPVKR